MPPQIRQYHDTDSNYRLPNDQTEHERLGLLNDVLRSFIGGSYLVPLRKPDVRDVLDICCGSGHWVLDMANEFPNARVVGLDISKPSVVAPSPSITFIQHDIKQGLPFEDAAFDFIQMRTVPSIPDRGELMVEIYRILRPGGFLAFFEPDQSISRQLQRRSPALAEVDRLLNKLPHMPRSKTLDEGTEQPNSWSIAHELEHVMYNSGALLFERGDVKSFFLPIGTWPEDPVLREMGRKMAIVQIRLIETLGDQFRKLPDFGDDEFHALQNWAREEVEDEALQLEMEFVYAWGRKL
ncbi:S-adenosyl-L-methionine-dependent methyltransferase [Chiua virens]|nr:S-adenosyl-L-methionine-dependent methyltransferase [Chiua virens]